MPSTYTLNNGIELIATGEQSGTWGDTTNTNLELLDTALDGQVTATLASAGSSGSPNTLPISDGAASNGRNRMVIFDDSSDLGATAYVQLTPNDAEKIIYVRNSLSGSRSILLFQGTYNASNDYELKAGTTAVIFFDGAGSGAVAANVLSDLQVEKLSVFGTAPTITLTDTDTGVDTELNAASSVGQFTLNIDKNNEGSAPRLVTQISGTEFFRINESGAVFNESSNDQDFRVESDNDTHMLFVDASTSRIGLITSAPAYTLDVLGQGRFRTSDSSVELTVESTDTTAAQGAKIILNHNKTAADGDVAGYIDFKANNDGASEHLFGRIQVDATDVSAGSEDGRLRLSTLVNGSTFEAMRITTGTVFNEGGIDADFRVESSGNTHMLFVDAGNDRLGVGLSAPSATLDVSGDAEFESGKIVIKEVTGADAYSEIRKTNTGSNFAVVSPESIFLLIDSNNDQTNRGLVIGHNSALPGSSTQLAIIAENGTVFNEPGADVDFRVESDTSTHAIFLDAANNKIGISDSSPSYTVDIRQNTNDANDGVNLQPNNQTQNMQYSFIGMTNTYFTEFMVDSADSGTTGYRYFKFYEGTRDTNGELLYLGYNATIFNEGGADRNFRVESDSLSHAIFVDAGNDIVSIGSSNGSNYGARMMSSIAGGSSSATIACVNTSTSGTRRQIDFFDGSSTTRKGSIETDGTSTFFNTTSDRRLKTDIQPITDGTEKLMAMNPVSHKWKAEPEASAVHGFIAQEMQDIVPEAVSGDPDGEEMMSMDYGRITPVLVAALQDAHNKIAALEKRLTELEAN